MAQTWKKFSQFSHNACFGGWWVVSRWVLSAWNNKIEWWYYVWMIWYLIFNAVIQESCNLLYVPLRWGIIIGKSGIFLFPKIRLPMALVEKYWWCCWAMYPVLIQLSVEILYLYVEYHLSRIGMGSSYYFSYLTQIKWN